MPLRETTVDLPTVHMLIIHACFDVAATRAIQSSMRPTLLIHYDEYFDQEPPILPEWAPPRFPLVKFLVKYLGFRLFALHMRQFYRPINDDAAIKVFRSYTRTDLRTIL